MYEVYMFSPYLHGFSLIALSSKFPPFLMNNYRASVSNVTKSVKLHLNPNKPANDHLLSTPDHLQSFQAASIMSKVDGVSDENLADLIHHEHFAGRHVDPCYSSAPPCDDDCVEYISLTRQVVEHVWCLNDLFLDVRLFYVVNFKLQAI